METSRPATPRVPEAITVVNLMKHACTLKIRGETHTFPPSGKVAHVEEILTPVNTVKISGVQVPICSRRFGTVENLPPVIPGTIYIVPSMVLQAVPERGDVFAPDSGKSAQRNDKGHVVSVCQLIGNG